jgi:uncharacterized protein YebE (UPF0316 family)
MYLLVFVLKLLDGVFSTLKNIFLIKGQFFLSALVSTIGTFFYLTMVVELAKATGVMATIVVCLANFIGTYVPSISMNKLEKDKLHVYNITSSTLEEGKSFADLVRKNNLAITTDGRRDENMEKVLFCEVYCKTREASKLLESLIPKSFKYNIQVPYDK